MYEACTRGEVGRGHEETGALRTGRRFDKRNFDKRNSCNRQGFLVTALYRCTTGSVQSVNALVRASVCAPLRVNTCAVSVPERRLCSPLPARYERSVHLRHRFTAMQRRHLPWRLYMRQLAAIRERVRSLAHVRLRHVHVRARRVQRRIACIGASATPEGVLALLCSEQHSPARSSNEDDGK